jgi:hypothetical protein
MPELRRQANGEQQKFEVALKSKLIINASLEEIKEVLRFVMVKIGLRANNWPNDLEKVILHQHIVENFGGNNVDEIRLAFEMGIAGKLGFLENESIVPFENFSCLYFSSVMNAYRRWSAQEYRQIAMKIEPPPPQRIFTQEELDDGFREDVERQYGSYLRGYDLRGIEFNKEILVKDGLIMEDETVIDLFRKSVEKGMPHIYVKGI